MAVKLDREQEDVAAIFADELRRSGASPIVQKALFAGGLVESGLRNLNHGDRDSLGSLQERTSIYGRKHALNPRASARRFITDATRLRKQGFKGSAGDLAQAVQRSAFPDRYDQRGGEADALRRMFGLGGGGASSPAGAGVAGGQQVQQVPQGPVQLGPAGGGTGQVAQLLAAMTQQPKPAASSGVPLPSFAAGAPAAALPTAGAMSVPSAGAPAPRRPAMDDLLSLAKASAVQAAQVTGGGRAPATSSGVDANPAGGQAAVGGVNGALAWAESKVGKSEVGGENRGKLPDRLNRMYGMSGQAWCAMFTSEAVTKGGAPASARTASVAEVRRKAKAGDGYVGFVNSKRGRAGDLILFGNNHIGMIERVTKKGYVMIAGNDSDRVNRRTVGFGSGDIVRPAYGRG